MKGTNPELGTKLKKAREAAGLTQAQVAAAAGLHVNYYAVIERGGANPSVNKVQSIMKVLNIKSLDLS